MAEFLKDVVDNVDKSFDVNAADLLSGTSEYYTYQGSMTTPDCAINVIWLLMNGSMTSDRNRSNSRWCETGLTLVMPSAKQTAEFAADPRRFSAQDVVVGAERCYVMHDQEVAGEPEALDHLELPGDLGVRAWHPFGPLSPVAAPDLADYSFIVPSFSIHRIQEVHATFVHVLWDLIHIAAGAEDVI